MRSSRVHPAVRRHSYYPAPYGDRAEAPRRHRRGGVQLRPSTDRCIVVALNGTPLNGTPVKGRWIAPSTLPAVPTQSHNVDGVTYIDVQGMDIPRQDALSATEQASSSANPSPWPAPDPFDLERARLVYEIAAANERVAGVRARIAIRESEMKVALRAEFVAARRVIAEMEREHEARIAAVSAAAEADVERILAEANASGAPDAD